MNFIIDLLMGKYTLVKKSNYYYYKHQHNKMEYLADKYYHFSGFPELKPIWDFVLFSKSAGTAREEYLRGRSVTE